MFEKSAANERSEEELELEKSRAIETAELLKKGAEFSEGMSGDLYLDVPMEVMTEIARNYANEKERIGQEKKKHEDTAPAREQWEADQEKLRAFNRSRDTVRDPQKVFLSMSDYFKKAETSRKNLKEICKNLSEDEKRIIELAVSGLEGISFELDQFIFRFECCWNDDKESIARQSDPTCYLKWDEREKLSRIVLGLLEKPQIRLDGATAAEQTQLDAVILDAAMNVWRKIATKSTTENKRGDMPAGHFEIMGRLYPSDSQGGGEGLRTPLELVSIKLSGELGLGTAEVYRELVNNITSNARYNKWGELKDDNYLELCKSLNVKPIEDRHRGRMAF